MFAVGEVRLYCTLILSMVVLGAIGCSCSDVHPAVEPAPAMPQPATVYSYKVVNTFPHDQQAYTQGLAYYKGVLYEGTGGYGRSAIRKVNLESGSTLQEYRLPAGYFGEGITLYKDKLLQLTWRSNTGFVYDRDSFNLLRQFYYPTEGWGITHDGNRIIMSDGTSSLYVLDPENFNITGRIAVHDQNGPVNALNELEYIKGLIFANVWPTGNIVIIEPASGSVTGWINLSGLLGKGQVNDSVDVLNGIAYDSESNRMFVTGKLWPWIFEIVPVAK